MQNVKPSVMERLARLTEADYNSLIDERFNSSQLGTCERFHVEDVALVDDRGRTYSKALATFDGCQKHLGCTVLLRGGSRVELCAVKRILRLAIFFQYNRRFETAFLCNEFATLPSPGGTRYEHQVARPLSLRDAIDRVVTSISPCVHIGLPFFETQLGRSVFLRQFMPEEIYSSYWTSDDDSGEELAGDPGSNPVKLQRNELARINKKNRFLDEPLVGDVSNQFVQEALACFRSDAIRVDPVEQTNSARRWAFSVASRNSRNATKKAEKVRDCVIFAVIFLAIMVVVLNCGIDSLRVTQSDARVFQG